VINLEKFPDRVTVADLQKLDKEKQDRIKILCQTDLRFLVNCVLRPSNSKKFPPLIEKVHGKIIDAFPRPDPNQDTSDWDEKDEFVILASRGMLKSTIGAAFLTQTILCAPDIRILIMSGKIEKARSILAVARKPFLSNQVIRHLFPEWAIEEDAIRAEDFVTPRRNPELDLRDPTISLASFDSVKAGGHYELILFDDATNEINSSNIENAEKTHGTYDDTDELIEPGGYRVFLGTKWLDEDLPEYIRRKGEEDKEKSGKETVSHFVLPAWVLRTDGKPYEISEREIKEKTGVLTPEDVILTWPEKLNAQFLFKRYRRNRADFYKQYLLDASLDDTPKAFTEAILTKQTRPATELMAIPQDDRSIVIYWDLATVFTGRKKKSDTDFSCGIVAVFQNSTGIMYVADAILAHFSSGRDVANAIIKLYKSGAWFGKVVGHGMEDAAGAHNLESQIFEIARETDVNLPPIIWQKPDNAPNAKNVRIAVCASAMRDGKIVLNADIPYLDDIRRQFEKWSIDAKRRKDDGPDCIAQIWQYYHPLIRPNSIGSMQPSEPILTWEPDAPDGAIKEEEDTHADEGVNADIEWMKSFNAYNV
jgi:hypothetical protein